MTNGYLFREYIGAQFTGVELSDVPVNAGLNFNFILSFAIDYTPVSPQATSTPTNGVFTPFWDRTNLSPAAVAAVKAEHPNVRVMVGLGGDSVQDTVKVFFLPTSVDSWVANAVTSLSAMINEYDLEGVDIDYEHFTADITVDTFVEGIGRLLTKLKADFPNITTSIVPYEDEAVQRHYQPLWQNYSKVIDYINFQFYTYGANTDVPNYPGGRVLTSFSTGTDPNLLSPEQGISAATELQRQNKLPGLFIWSADNSKTRNNGFDYETREQQIVADH